MSSADMTFKESSFRFYQTEPANLYIWSSVDLAGDPSVTKGKDPDYNVVCTCGKNLKTGEIYVLHYDRFRGNPSDLIDKMFEHHRLYHPVLFRVESVGYQNTLAHWIKIRQKKDGVFFTIDCITHGKRSKATRILGLQPFFHDKRVYLKPWMRELQHELLTFPLGKHDDVIDALAMQTEFWKTTRSEREDARETSDPNSVEAVMEDLRSASAAKRPGLFGELFLERQFGSNGAYDDVLQASGSN
jgi:predicted phage terminase large subunit-like protein